MERWPRLGELAATEQDTGGRDAEMAREGAAWEAWHDLWLEAALRLGIRVRTQSRTRIQTLAGDADASYMQAWGTHFGARRQFWDTVRRWERMEDTSRSRSRSR